MASRFWVGGTGTWDSSSTTHWSATSGGASGASVPGSSDTVTFDGSSGGGTVTVNFGGPITIQSLTMGAFTGTWDNSVNNNNFTITNSLTAFSISGSGTRTIRLGSATYTLSNAIVTFAANTTNLTLTAGSATIAFTGGAGNKTVNLGGASVGTITLPAISGSGASIFSTSGTIATLSMSAPNALRMANGSTITVSNAATWTGTASSPIYITSDAIGSTAAIALAGGSTITWAGIRDIAFTGSPTASNTLDLGNVSGVTITAPGPGSGSGGVIGS